MRSLWRPRRRWVDNIKIDLRETWDRNGLRKVECSCECGNEPSGSIKYLEVVDWLHNWWRVE
jgi:hypothetical protein